MCWDTSTAFLVVPSSFTISYVDPNVAAKKVDGNISLLFSWHWPGYDELRLSIVTSIIDMSIMSFMSAAIADLPECSQKCWELLDCYAEPTGDGCPYTCNDTTIIHNNTATGLAMASMRLQNPSLLCIVYWGQQGNGTSSVLTPMCAGRSYLHLEDIITPTAKNMIAKNGEESYDNAKTWHPNPKIFPKTITGFHQSERIHQWIIIRQQNTLKSSKLCSWSDGSLWTKQCCWWECGLATRARSHCESSRCSPFRQ